MTQKIVMVDHKHATRDDRATELLEARGYEIEWRRPAAGDSLPDPDAGYVAAVVHGGIENLSESDDIAYITDELRWIRRWVEAGNPYLGICLGGQLLAQAFDAEVAPHPDGVHEIGFVQVQPTEHAADFMCEPVHVYQWHQEGFELPAQATLLATGDVFGQQAFRLGRHAYGLQFHPEVSTEILLRWVDGSTSSLEKPGAHSRARQSVDGARYVPAMSSWLSGFLDLWLGSAPNAADHGRIAASANS